MTDQRRIDSIAAEGAGIVSRSALIDAGLTEASIDHAVRAGRLLPIHAGVYRAAAVPDSLAIRHRAALAATAPHGVLSHRSAAHLLDLPGGWARIELTVPHACRPRLDVVVHRSHRIPEQHITTVAGRRTTRVERTVGDLGAVVDLNVVRSAAETAVVRRLTTVERLFEHVDQHARRGRNGIGVLRSVLEDWMLSERPPDSELEIAFMRLVKVAGLPTPQHQYEIRTADGRSIARVDAAWPNRQVVVEIDGFSAHGSPSAMQRDLARQNQLVLAGWTVIRFTWHDVIRRPRWVADQIGAALDHPG